MLGSLSEANLKSQNTQPFANLGRSWCRDPVIPKDHLRSTAALSSFAQANSSNDG
jgi:hypothetical protein